MADIGEPIRRRRVMPLEEPALPSKEEPRRERELEPAEPKKKVPVDG